MVPDGHRLLGVIMRVLGHASGFRQIVDYTLAFRKPWRNVQVLSRATP
jgi:hypothetical protein